MLVPSPGCGFPRVAVSTCPDTISCPNGVNCPDHTGQPPLDSKPAVHIHCVFQCRTAARPAVTSSAHTGSRCSKSSAADPVALRRKHDPATVLSLLDPDTKQR